MHLLMVAATVVLRFTNPSFQGDTLVGGCEPDERLPVHLSVTRLYRAVIPNGSPVLVRSRPATAGVADTFQVPDQPPSSYFVAPVNNMGEGCWAGITIGVPPVSVPPKESGRVVWFDVAGRRFPQYPTASGVYTRVVMRAGRIVEREKIVIVK